MCHYPDESNTTGYCTNPYTKTLILYTNGPFGLRVEGEGGEVE